MSTQDPTSPELPAQHHIGFLSGGIGAMADKLLSGVGLLTEEMPLAGAILKNFAEMWSNIHNHAASAQHPTP